MLRLLGLQGAATGQDAFGKYGVIRETDADRSGSAYIQKPACLHACHPLHMQEQSITMEMLPCRFRSEFVMWAAEVKKADVEGLPKWEEKELFKYAGAWLQLQHKLLERHSAAF